MIFSLSNIKAIVKDWFGSNNKIMTTGTPSLRKNWWPWTWLLNPRENYHHTPSVSFLDKDCTTYHTPTRSFTAFEPMSSVQSNILNNDNTTPWRLWWITCSSTSERKLILSCLGVNQAALHLIVALPTSVLAKRASKKTSNFQVLIALMGVKIITTSYWVLPPKWRLTC